VELLTNVTLNIGQYIHAFNVHTFLIYIVHDFIGDYSDFQLLVAAMRPPVGGSNEISGRFTRHMFTVCIDSFEDKTLDKIFSSIMDWHFAKGFDANVARLSKVSTGNILC
jgi:hypothetical protein